MSATITPQQDGKFLVQCDQCTRIPGDPSTAARAVTAHKDEAYRWIRLHRCYPLPGRTS